MVLPSVHGARVAHSFAQSPRRPKGWVGTIAFALVAAFLSACHSAPPPLTAQEAAGKHLYEARCAHCHEESDLELKKVPPDLHALFARGTLPSGIPTTDEAVKQDVLKGRGMMPGFAGRFDDEQVAALLAYLHTGLR